MIQVTSQLLELDLGSGLRLRIELDFHLSAYLSHQPCEAGDRPPLGEYFGVTGQVEDNLGAALGDDGDGP